MNKKLVVGDPSGAVSLIIYTNYLGHVSEMGGIPLPLFATFREPPSRSNFYRGSALAGPGRAREVAASSKRMHRRNVLRKVEKLKILDFWKSTPRKIDFGPVIPRFRENQKIGPGF